MPTESYLSAVPALRRVSRRPELAELVKSFTADAQSHRAGKADASGYNASADRAEAQLFGTLLGVIMTFNPTTGYEIARVATNLLMGYDQNWAYSGPDWIWAATKTAL